MAFLAALREANEEDENAFPVGYCIKLYEELNAVWCEQIRESRRKLCAKLGTENPRLEDLKLVALSPGPDGTPAFQFPRVWDLQDPQGYYQQVILPRQQRAMTRLWNKQLHEQALSSTRRSNKTAGNEEATDPGDAADPKAGKGPNLRLKRNDREEVPSGPTAEGPTDKSGEPPHKAYPAGRRLTPQEVTRSVKHAPVDPKSGKPICWDAACHIGCNRSSCPNAHEPLPALGKLDPTVAMQVLRRGGLRGEKKIDPKDVDGRVAQLRSQMKEEQASKQADGKGDKPGKPKGKAKASGKAKAGWQLPEDYSGPLTVMEKELSEIGLGPDLAWHEAYRPGRTVDTTPVDDPRAEQRIEVYKQLKAAGTLDPIANCGPHLYCHVASRLDMRPRSTFRLPTSSRMPSIMATRSWHKKPRPASIKTVRKPVARVTIRLLKRFWFLITMKASPSGILSGSPMLFTQKAWLSPMKTTRIGLSFRREPLPSFQKPSLMSLGNASVCTLVVFLQRTLRPLGPWLLLFARNCGRKLLLHKATWGMPPR